MFQSAQYEGLPFVGHSRLRRALSRFDSGSQTPHAVDADARSRNARAFLESYFRVQEECYHALLECVGQASDHLDYWLDWMTPVRGRPLWLHRLGRRCAAGYLVMRGRGAQVASPSKAARQFAVLHADLCRLVAFIQVSSFETLSLAEAPDDALDLIEESLQNLAWQARSCRQVAASLHAPPASPRGPMRGLTSHGLDRGRTENFDLDAAGIEGLQSARPDVRPDVRLGGGAGEDAGPREALVGSSWAHLRASSEAVHRLAGELSDHFSTTGRLTHWQRCGPIYGVGLFCGFSWAVVALRDPPSRRAFVEYISEVFSRFCREWIYDPVQEIAGQLFRRLTSEDTLNVQLQELRMEQEALERMLSNFASIVRFDPLLWEKAKARGGDKLAEPIIGDDLAERYFERSMTNPIYNVMHGHMLESCMVQTQRMKVLLYASLYSIDVVLLQLKWDFLMAGVMPFVTLCGVAYSLVSGLRTRRQRGWNRRMIRALAEVDRFYNHHASGMAVRQAPAHHHHGREGGQETSTPTRAFSSTSLRDCCGTERGSGNVLSTAQALPLEKIGAALGHLDALCRLASRVRLEATDWRCFRRDILDLTSPELSPPQKLHVVAAMRSTYHVFQAFA